MVYVIFSFCLYLYTCVIIAQVSSDAVVCPDGGVCAEDNTCCLLASKVFACCNLPEATCCSDHTHCCPQDYACNVTAGTCYLGNKVQEWLTKTPTKPVKDSVCRNNSGCPEGSVCCILPSGIQDCCPLLSFVCPGGRYSCPHETTCCEMQTGEMGCCPYNSGTCCSDGLHCCPQHYECNLAASTCVRGTEIVKLQAKLTAIPLNVTVTCNDTGACPDIYTCCDSGPSQYGCCPMREAVCCSDNMHCCPQGYQCDISTGTCNKAGSEALAWLTGKPSRTAATVTPETET